MPSSSAGRVLAAGLARDLRRRDRLGTIRASSARLPPLWGDTGRGTAFANLTLTKIPLLGNIRIGNQKEPFSLEHLNSYRYLEFLERSPLFDAFSPTAFNNGFTPGISVFNTALDEHVTWAIGVYKNENTLLGFGLGDGQYAVTGRLTGLPVYLDDGETLLHVAIAGSHRDPENDLVLLRARGSVRNAPFPLLPLLANTGPIRSTSQDLFDTELAMVCGPVTIEAEYTGSSIQDATQRGIGNVGTYYSQGYYVQALCFLTGERRTYNRQSATFNRVVPLEPFFLVPGHGGPLFGRGAWEAGVRFSYLDLTNRGIQGGVLHDVTVGLNWYLNPNAKIQWNYDIAHRGGLGQPSDGTVQAFGVRMALDF